MTTTKASVTIPMPDGSIFTVRDLYQKTRMSCIDFRIFTRDVRFNAIKHLDISGFVSVEAQDPAALRHFLDQIKKSDPTIAKRYPYLWPVLAYLELYLYGRRRSHYHRLRRDGIQQSTLPRAPIWVRFAHSEKTGQSLQEVSDIKSDRPLRVSRTTPRRADRRRPMVKKSYKREPTEATVTEADESITRPVDSTPAGSSNRITAPVRYFLGSFGSSIEEICAQFVSG